ncbi:AAA family ATPase [Magnetofaba australis]|nr:DUF3696 domain-containing protein [Magnetofaba australis]
MILKALTLENFKGIREPVRIEFAPVTLLFGPNNAGKSTVVQALHYAREIFERGNADPGRTLLGGDVLDLGGFDSLVHSHDRSLPIRMRFELDLSKAKLPFQNYFSMEEWQSLTFHLPKLAEAVENITSAIITFSVSWDDRLERPIPTYLEISLNGQLFARISNEDGELVLLSTLDMRHPALIPFLAIHESPETLPEAMFEYNDGNTVEKPRFILLWDSAIPTIWKENLAFPDGRIQPRWWSAMWTPPEPDDPPEEMEDTRDYWEEPDIPVDQLVRFLSTLILGPGNMLHEALHSYRYISPFRDVPLRNHQPARAPDEFRWSNGMAAWDLLLLKGETLVEKVNAWLTQEERLNAGYRVEVKRYKELEVNGPLMMALTGETVLDDEEWIRDAVRSLPERRQLLIRDQRRDVELFPQDVGVGISQVVPVLVAALHSQMGIVAIEEPESNIHPAFQVTLGDLFISQTREKPDLMFLVETHSEHLMLRFLRRIRETGENELPPGAPSLTPEGIAVYFVEPEEDGPRIHRIRIDRDGDFIDRWPRGFFQERMKELYGS